MNTNRDGTAVVRTILSALAMVIFFTVSASAQTRPNPTPIQTSETSGLPGTPFFDEARDTTITEAWGTTETGSGIAQMYTADSLTVVSTSASDSSKFALKIIDNATYQTVTINSQLNGTSIVYIPTYKALKVLGFYADTTLQGTVSVKTKAAASGAFGVVATIPAGQGQTYVAGHWFGAKAGVVKRLMIYPAQFSPMVEYELRLYRSHLEARVTPEKGYSVLYRGYTGGPWMWRPQVAKQIVAGANDTSVTMFIFSSDSTYNWASAITAVGTSNTAFYYSEAPGSVTPSTTWSDIKAIDSLSTTGLTTTANVRYKRIVLHNAGGNWIRVIANGKAAAGDTSTVTTSITPARWSFSPVPVIVDLDIACPTYSYVGLYTRSFGWNASIDAAISGYEVR